MYTPKQGDICYMNFAQILGHDNMVLVVILDRS